MKWNKKMLPKNEEARWRKKFCWLPYTYANVVYWLEFVEIQEMYYRCSLPEAFMKHGEWIPIAMKIK